MKKPAGLTDNLRGILLLVASVTCFGVVDGISKMLIETQSFGQVMLARYVLALPILLLRTGRHMVIPAARHELFMEADPIRGQVLAAFDAFITNQSA